MKSIKKLMCAFVFSIFSVILICPFAFAEDPIIIEKPLIEDYKLFFEEDPYIADIQFKPLFNNDPADPYINDSSIIIELDGTLTKDGRAALNWTPYLEPNFSMYKVVHDQIDKNPYYPKHGYLDYFESAHRTGYLTGKVPAGDNYFRICVITKDNKRGCSNTISIFVEQPTASSNTEVENKPNIKEEIIKSQLEKLPNINGGFMEKAGDFIIGNLGTILAIVGVLVAISGFTFAAKNKRKSISKYINQIDDTYSEYKMKAKRCEAELYRLRDIVDEQLKTAKIDEGAYQLLMNRIEGYMIEIQKQIVNEKFGGLPINLKNQMFKMMEDGEINESEFEAIQKLIKRSELSSSEQESLIETINDFKKQDEVMKKKNS